MVEVDACQVNHTHAREPASERPVGCLVAEMEERPLDDGPPINKV